MEKYKISKTGRITTLVNFLVASEKTVRYWVSDPKSSRYELCKKIMSDLEEAQAETLAKWEEKLTYTGIIRRS